MKGEWEGCLAYCSAKCMPGGYREGGDKDTEGQGPRDLGRGAREDKGGRADRGQDRAKGPGQREGAKEEALPRELLRNVLALAGGQRDREGGAGKRACHGGMKERAWGGNTKVPHHRASRPRCAGALDKAEHRGALPQGGPPPWVQCSA